MGKIYLKVAGQEEPKAVQIEEMTIGQFKKGMKIFKKVLDEVKDDENLKEMMQQMMGDSDEELSEEEKKAKDSEFGVKLAKSFGYLVEEVPDQATDLLAIITGIEPEVVDEQPLSTLFDMFDRFVEENDLPKLVERAKKSLSVTKVKWQIQKATGKKK